MEVTYKTAALWREDAATQAAAAERAKVVRWLRDKVTKTRLVGLLERVDHLADDIEALAHHEGEAINAPEGDA